MSNAPIKVFTEKVSIYHISERFAVFPTVQQVPWKYLEYYYVLNASALALVHRSSYRAVAHCSTVIRRDVM